MKKMGSIYDRIKGCIESSGVLLEDFVLEERECKENELHFAPGALEGILGHHSSGNGAGESLAEKLKEYLKMPLEAAMANFEREVATDGQMASARKGIRKVILEHQEEYDAGKVFDLAQFFAVNGRKVETVKLGLSLLALFDTGDLKEVREILGILGCCEEFTDYVLSASETWAESDRQELYFELAKKLHGWGKISAVERMEADTKEKKEWILCYGCKNTIMNAYLGLVCAEKCDFEKRLQQGNLTEEQFLGAREIMDGLLDEGPCEGLSAWENPAKLVLLYLGECGKHFLDVDMVVQLADIRAFFDELDESSKEVSDRDDLAQVLTEIDSLLSDMNLQVFAADNMAEKPHQCIRIAKEFGLDVSSDLIALMEREFERYYQFCYYLLQREAYVEEFFRICEREIREEDYPNEMGDSFGFGARERKGIMLDVIVQYLGQYPLCGKKMIRICLHSPITRWRNMAGKALLGWVMKLGGTLADIDAGLYAIVEDVAARECNEGTMEIWRKLLVQ